MPNLMAGMIETVKARRRGAQDFEGYYSQLCALQDSCPLTAVKAHLDDGVLDLNADRIRQPDWTPILNALRINRSLQFIAFRSYFQSNKQDDPKSHLQAQVRRLPPVRSRDVMHRLSITLRECLTNSEALQHLELQGLLLREKNVVSLCKGLAKSRSIQHLSLEYCRIGDRGVEIICQCIKNTPTIISLNLTGAGLTWKSADMLGKLVKHQATRRHTEAWKDSLRYRRPDLDRMPGIRRITINNNPMIDDRGAKALAEALKDDLWLKALDMQHCGLSNAGAKAFLDTLHHNTSIVVLDLRRNPLLDKDLLKSIIEQVMINSDGQEIEYKWLRARTPKDSSSSKLKIKYRGRSSSLHTRKPSSSRMKGTSSHKAVDKRTRSKSESGMTIVRSKPDKEPPVTRPGPGFVPWRTAARANQRSKSILSVDVGSPDSTSTPSKAEQSTIHIHVGSSSDLDTSMKNSTDVHTPSTGIQDAGYEATVSRKIKQLQVEAEELRRRLYIESQARAASDERLIELEVENSRLKHQLQLLEAKGPTSPLKKRQAEEGEEENGEDDALLKSIEESFQKFHGFLDLLRDAGLGQLCTLVGMSSQDIGHPAVKSILKNHLPSTQQQGAHPAVSSSAVQPGIYQPGNLVYSNQAVQPAPYNAYGMMGPPMAPTYPNFISQQQQQGANHSTASGSLAFQTPNQVPSTTSGPMPFQQVPGMPLPIPGVYPQMMSAYSQQMPVGAMPLMQGQMPLNQAVPPQLQMYHHSQPVLANQQPNSAGLPNGGSDKAPSTSTSTSVAQTVFSSGLATSASVTLQNPPIPVTSEGKVISVESMSSTEGVFIPSVVQISGGSKLPDDIQETIEARLPTVQTNQPAQVSKTSDDNDHPGTRSDTPLAQGQEVNLQRVEDSFESDIGNIRQMTELDFGESVEPTPEAPGTKSIEDSPRVESVTPTKGIGSPTESDHSGRGPPRGASPTPSYSEDFERGDNDSDDSVIEEDIFKDSEGSLPGLTSDEDF